MLERWFLKWWWINEHIVDHVQTGRHYQLATECGSMNYCLQEDKIELLFLLFSLLVHDLLWMFVHDLLLLGRAMADARGQN